MLFYLVKSSLSKLAGQYFGNFWDSSYFPQAKPSLVESLVDIDGWNDYRILCEGKMIKFWLNDTLVLEYEETEEGIAEDGVICVQIHGGVPAEAWYKDIEIRTLGE